MNLTDIEKTISDALEANHRELFVEAEAHSRAALELIEKRGGSKARTTEDRVRLDILRCRASNQLVNSMRRRGYSLQVLPVAEESLRVAERTGDDQCLAGAVSTLATVYAELHRFEEAIANVERSLAIKERMGDVQMIARDRGRLGDYHLQLSRFELALSTLERARTEFESVGDLADVAASEKAIGSARNMMGDHKGALVHLNRALEFQSNHGSKEGTSKTLMEIGSAYVHLSDYPTALEYMHRALELCTETGDKVGSALTTANMGALYRALGDLPLALDYVRRALALDVELGLRHAEAISVGNIGEILRGMGQLDEALEYFYRAQTMCETIGARRPLGYWLKGIGNALSELGRNDEALVYLEQALTLRRDELKTEEDVPETLIIMGTVLGKLGRIDEGMECANEALAQAERKGQKKDASSAHLTLAQLFEQRGDAAAAFAHWKQYAEQSTAVTGAETQRKIDALTTRLTVAESQREAEKIKQKAEQLEMEIARQKQDLANKALQLVQQSEILRGFRVELEGIIANANTAEQAIHVVQKKLRDLPVNVMNWNKFVGEFRAVHPEFEQQLKEKYSALSKVEIKVCCLLRIGMATREIATILFLSERTVEGHRVRIRKKMNVPPPTDLAASLAEI